jgi:hypothetical protein
VLGAWRRPVTGTSAVSWFAGRGRIQEDDRFFGLNVPGDARKTIFGLSLGCDWRRPCDGGTGRA